MTIFDKLYLEWVNDWLTIEKWSEHYEMTPEQGKQMIELLKSIYESKGE